MSLSEKQIESRLIQKCRKHGVFLIKNTGMNGLPDRLMIFCGRFWFVELKRPGARPVPLQRAVARRLRAAGAVCLCADSYEAVDEILNAFLSGSPPPEKYIY